MMFAAKCHVMALEKLDKGANTYNLRTKRGTSVLELGEYFHEG